LSREKKLINEEIKPQRTQRAQREQYSTTDGGTNGADADRRGWTQIEDRTIHPVRCLIKNYLTGQGDTESVTERRMNQN
jgi:hypothetical protein